MLVCLWTASGLALVARERQSLVRMFIGLELLAIAVVAFATTIGGSGGPASHESGALEAFVIVFLVVAACEAALGLSVLVVQYLQRHDLGSAALRSSGLGL